MSRPQGCSQQCFHLWHYTVQNTDVRGNVLLLQSVSGTEGGWKPDSDSGACLGNPLFTTRTCLLPSTVPDTQPGLHPGAQQRGWKRLTSSAAFHFSWLCPPCQVLVPWEITPLLTAFVGWFGCGHSVLKAVPLCATCNPRGCCGCSLGSGRRSRMSLGLQGLSSALPTGELCPWGASCCFCAGCRIPSPRDMPLPGTSGGAQRFAACLLLPAWVLLCFRHRLCASRASPCAWCSRDAPPPASAATGRAAFGLCPEFSWLRVVNSQRGGALQCFLPSHLTSPPLEVSNALFPPLTSTCQAVDCRGTTSPTDV